jgi:hypothetical protein
MKPKNPIWMIVVFFSLVSISCAFPQAAKPTPTPTLAVAIGIKGIGGSGGSGGNAGGAGSGGSGSGGGGSGGNNAASTPVPTPLPTPGNPSGPYTVKQTESLGGETIAGIVCDVTKPFIVNVSSPKVPFTFYFVPESSNKGGVTYAYNIPSAGESHDATGSYTISLPGVDGTLVLNMTVSDHVVFKGFDGKIPVSYIFNLVPENIPNCQNNP